MLYYLFRITAIAETFWARDTAGVCISAKNLKYKQLNNCSNSIFLSNFKLKITSTHKIEMSYLNIFNP
jgi:hypothetical protein